jgi:erythromycin esterase-like protein
MAVGVRFVLLGEATHGSHELYRERVRITQRLISDQGFNGVVVEADWPDADRANRWAQGRSDDESAEAALCGFRRFPTWMWRNAVVVDFLSWLRAHNESSGWAPTVFQGMDLYSLYASMDAVVKYLERHDPAAAERARERYACFEITETGDGGEGYGQATRFDTMEPCEETCRCPASSSPCTTPARRSASCGNQCSSAPSASSAGRGRSAIRIISRRVWRRSSTPWCTSIAPAPSSRSSARRRKQRSRPRLTPLRCNP